MLNRLPHILAAWMLPLFALAQPVLNPPLTLGYTELSPAGQDGPVSVYYRGSGEERLERRGRMTLSLARDPEPRPGNGRLIVISHGSGGSPWVFADLARTLVEAGFVVALPRHLHDNYLDDGEPGPDSWKRRPAEVSRAIDRIAAEPRLAALLTLDRVGMFGISAGGHTALSLAGGVWSPALYLAHCEAHLQQDFNACVGLATQLNGGWLDGLKQWAARRVLRHRFDDPTPQAFEDARIVAVVAGVPAAADFDMDSLREPHRALALITAGKDIWLHPQFHSDRVLQACLPRCELLAALPEAAHGVLLSPLPPGMQGLEGQLVNDPPGFDRSQLPALHQRIADFFTRQILGQPAEARVADQAMKRSSSMGLPSR